MKNCNYCGIELTAENHYMNRLHLACKKCLAKKSKEYYLKNIDRLKIQNRDYYTRTARVKPLGQKKKCMKCLVELNTQNQYQFPHSHNQNLCKNCSIKKSKDYYKENKEKIKERNLKRYYENIDESRRKGMIRSRKRYENPEYRMKTSTYHKKWRERNKDCIKRKRNEYLERNPHKREKYNKKSKLWWKTIKNEIEKIHGNDCHICGESFHTKARHLHEIKNNRHSHSPKYIKIHLDEFISVCPFCHYGIHFCNKRLGMNWNSILERIYLIREGKI